MSFYLQQQIQTRVAAQGLSVRALERTAGLKPNAVGNILRGSSKKPRTEVVKALAGAFGCTTDDLVGPANKTSVVNAVIPLKESNKWDEGLYVDVVKLVLKAVSANKKLNLNFEQVMALVNKTYKYSIAKSSNKADPDFIAWIIDEYFNKNS